MAAAGAPKAKKPKVQVVIAPKTLEERKRFKIADVSISDASGWRDVDARRVKELKTDFLAGLFGVNILKRPMILCKHGKVCLAPDGNAMILDGKHTFKAIGELTVTYKASLAMAEDWPFEDDPAMAGDASGSVDPRPAMAGVAVAEEIMWSPLLIEAITEGVPCDMVQFDDPDDDDAPIAYCVAAHDEAANKYKPSSVRDAVGVANRYKNRVAGGTWPAVQALLTQLYGSGRRKFVYNMVLAAETLPDAILKRADDAGIPNSYIYDNKYFSGQNQDKVKRLGDKGRLSCLDIYEEDVLQGGKFSVKSFTEEVCAPMRHAEQWIASKKKQYGALAASPSFQRVADYLLSGRARLPILGCMRIGLRLEGTSADHMGVEQCYILIKDVEAQQKAAVAACEKGEPGVAPEDDSAKTEANAAEALTSMSVGLSGQCEVEDTARVSANAKTEAVMNRFNYFKSVGDVSHHLNPILHRGNKVMVFIDCITSKSRVGLQHIADFGTFLSQNGHKESAVAAHLKVRLAVPTGTRLDYTTAVGNKIDSDCASLEIFLVQLTCGPAQKRRRPHFCWVAVDKESAKTLVIPNSIDALARRAKACEGVRMRCLDRHCPLRSVEEKMNLEVVEGEKEKPPPFCEIDEEHNEFPVADVVEEDDDEGAAEETIIIPPGTDRSCIRDLYPFAYGKEYYVAMITGIVGSEAIAHFVYIAATAHPSALLAAQELGMGVHIVLSKVGQHSTSHGQLLLRKTIFNDIYEVEKKSAQHAKRVLLGDLAFVPINAPSEQPVFFFDVPPTGCNWRSGIDLCPATDFLERAVPKLLSYELEKFGLGIADERGVKRLVATRGFREEEIIGSMTALLFSEASTVVEFLNSGGNAALLDAPLMQVLGLLQSSAFFAATAAIFAIPTGVGRLLCDYRTVRKFANVSIVAVPSDGPQDGFLQMKARTHNGCGIASGATLCCDFGERYVAASAGDIQPAKRFRGSLEVFFSEQAAAAAAVAEASEGPASPARTAATASAAKTAATASPAKTAATAAATAATAATTATVAISTPPKAKVPAKAGSSTTASGAVATVAAASGSAGGSKTVLANSGDWELATSGGHLLLTNRTMQNKRVMPKTVLHLFTKGTVDDAPGAMNFPFTFKKPNEIVLMSAKAGSGYDVVTLKDVIKETSANALYQHGTFTKAVAPPTFTCKKVMQYNPHADEKAACSVVGGGLSSVEVALRWVVSAPGGKVTPTGVALVVSKQISLAAEQVKVLC